MIDREISKRLDRLIGQLDGIHQEISALSKKSPHDAVNDFKLAFINDVLNQSNGILGDKFRPFGAFVQFDSSVSPSTSDVSFMILQYLKAMKKFRSDNP